MQIHFRLSMNHEVDHGAQSAPISTDAYGPPRRFEQNGGRRGIQAQRPLHDLKNSFQIRSTAHARRVQASDNAKRYEQTQETVSGSVVVGSAVFAIQSRRLEKQNPVSTFASCGHFDR